MSCAETLGRLATLLYALHSSEWMIVPGETCAYIRGNKVAALRLLTSSMYPSAGVWDVSANPKTHIS